MGLYRKRVNNVSNLIKQMSRFYTSQTWEKHRLPIVSGCKGMEWHKTTR